MNSLSNLKVLVCGQLITSRTETIEEYLKNKVLELGIIGITSPFAIGNVSRCSLYKKGKLIREFKLPSFQIKNMKWYKQPLLFISYLLHFYAISTSVLRLRKKFDLFIGVSSFSGFLGVFLKKMGIIEKTIFYTTDFAPLVGSFGFDYLGRFFYNLMDKKSVINSDVVWHVSPRIAEAREKFSKISKKSYKHIMVPLGYSFKLEKNRSFDEINRWAIGFIGTLSKNQGLQLLVEAMPEIVRKLPHVRVHVVGHGPYANELIKMVNKSNLKQYFIFHGFIKNDYEAIDIISRCAIGVAPWTLEAYDNSLYADPGKPKYYAICGLPTIITKGPLIATEIKAKKAGIVINYTKEELVQAAIKILGNKEYLKKLRANALSFANCCLSEKIFDEAFRRTLKLMGSSKG